MSTFTVVTNPAIIRIPKSPGSGLAKPSTVLEGDARDLLIKPQSWSGWTPNLVVVSKAPFPPERAG